MKHIFITSVASFLGANLADYYLKKNFKVTGCDNLIGDSFDNVDKADCKNLEKMKKITKRVDVMVIHAS